LVSEHYLPLPCLFLVFPFSVILRISYWFKFNVLLLKNSIRNLYFIEFLSFLLNFCVKNGTKSKVLNMGFASFYKFRFHIKSILDAENVESFGNVFRFMILCLILEFSVLFWHKIAIFRSGFRGSSTGSFKPVWRLKMMSLF
jgi:hypothetical protein